MKTSLSVPFAAALLALTCTACGSQDSRSGAAPAPNEPATTTTTSDPTPTAELRPLASPTSAETSSFGAGDSVATYTWKDVDGYLFSVEASGLAVAAETNTADQKPGEGAITMTIGGQVTFTNGTPGRNASPEWVEVRPAWPLDSVFCEVSENFQRIVRGYDADPFGSGAKFTPTSYCWGPAVRAYVDGDGTLAEGESQTVMLDDSQPVQTIVPESALATATSQAHAPSFWAIVRGIGGPQTKRGDGICSYGSGGGGTSPIVVITSSGGADVCQQNVQ